MVNCAINVRFEWQAPARSIHAVRRAGVDRRGERRAGVCADTCVGLVCAHRDGRSDVVVARRDGGDRRVVSGLRVAARHTTGSGGRIAADERSGGRGLHLRGDDHGGSGNVVRRFRRMFFSDPYACRIGIARLANTDAVDALDGADVERAFRARISGIHLASIDHAKHPLADARVPVS